MIELRTSANESIDLDATISIEENNPSFASDVIPGAFSMPFTLMATPKNRRIFGFPDVLSIAELPSLRITGITLFAEGLPLRVGELIFRSVSNTRYTVNFQGQISLLGVQFSGKNIRDLNHQPISLLGSFIPSYEGKKFVVFTIQSYSFIENAPFRMKINGQDFEDIPPATGAVTGGYRLKSVAKQINEANIGIYSEVTDDGFGGSILFKTTSAGIDNLFEIYFYDYTNWNMVTLNWVTAYHDQLKPALASQVNNSYPDKSFVFPKIYNPGLYSEKVKNQFGYMNMYQNNAFTFNDFDASLFTGENPMINRATFCPMFFLHYVFDKIQESTGVKLTGDFIADANLKKLIIYNNRTLCRFEKFHYDFEYNVYDYRFNPANHLPSMTINEFLLELKKMFCLGFDYDSDTNTLKIYKLKGTINNSSFVDFSSKINPNYDFELEEFTGTTFDFKFEGKDEFYTKKIDKAPLGPLVIGNGKTKKETAWSTLYFLFSRTNKFPQTSHPGGPDASDFSPRLLFYYGLQTQSLGPTPFASWDDKSTEGTSLGPYHLSWDGPKGLYNQFWKEWDNFEQKTVLVKRQGYLSIVDLMNFDYNKKIRIHGINYICKKISYTIKKSGGLQPVKLELYKADV